MAGRCTICKSKKRAEIEAELVKGTSVRAIGTKFGLTKDSVSRHQLKCVSTAIAKASEEKGLALRERLLDEVESLQAITMEILDKARNGFTVLDKDGNPVQVTDPRTALAGVSEARSNLALLARMTGKLQPNPQEGQGATLVTWEQFTMIYKSRTTQQ